jgi:hypothetical protein
MGMEWEKTIMEMAIGWLLAIVLFGLCMHEKDKADTLKARIWFNFRNPTALTKEELIERIKDLNRPL